MSTVCGGGSRYSNDIIALAILIIIIAILGTSATRCF
ncbi:hypothetical protein EDD73_10220 [Heliophilum fasciatum]|uniref:Uncharacterized protein n=1 Tax=Heliophilum fasciatum TaxID=35700 RepID=A0A4R2SBS1_9FIRM|nr:hypothetical protein [Heliophilum fasciatum]TCP68625.1 hypothetical protein EDD73_10220 [Heliophilum fasciatum]